MDLIIISADIYTGDSNKPFAQAIGIKNGKIAAIGTDKDIKPLATKETEIVNLSGKFIIPGLVDSHIHFVMTGNLLKMVDLRYETSIHECREKIRDAALNTEKGKWIFARGWNNFKWDAQKYPDINDLDDIAPDNPVMMKRVCGHSILVNSKALEICNITEKTCDPSGGKIGRFESGKPDGMIYEKFEMITDHIPHLSFEEIKEAVLAAQKQAHQFGLTGVHAIETLTDWEAFNDLDKNNELKIRVNCLFQSEDLEEVNKKNILKQSSEYLWYGHSKMFADGSLGSSTALTHEPYKNDPDQYGLAFQSKNELIQNIRKSYETGLNVAVHAIGDKALSDTIDAISTVRNENRSLYESLSGSDRIEHVQLFKTSDLKKMKELGIIASVQPAFLSTDWELAEKQWGIERCKNGYAWRTILNNGIQLQFGSDSPVEPADPLLGFHAAFTRQATDGKPEDGWFFDQKLTLEEIIRGYTLQPAVTSGKINESGTITIGKHADLTILNNNLFKSSSDNWLKASVEMTIVAGEIVYRK
ncbi:MAG: amidohydrolase [Desulfobacterales bacterium]|nr:amidohydrolase [Desulfobacterales bacterium]